MSLKPINETNKGLFSNLTRKDAALAVMAIVAVALIVLGSVALASIATKTVHVAHAKSSIDGDFSISEEKLTLGNAQVMRSLFFTIAVVGGAAGVAALIGTVVMVSKLLQAKNAQTEDTQRLKRGVAVLLPVAALLISLCVISCLAIQSSHTYEVRQWNPDAIWTRNGGWVNPQQMTGFDPHLVSAALKTGVAIGAVGFAGALLSQSHRFMPRIKRALSIN